MLLCIIGLTLLCGILCLVALISMISALFASLQQVSQGTPTLSLMLPRQQREPTESSGSIGKRAGRRKAW
jgi:hypothetical protein